MIVEGQRVQIEYDLNHLDPGDVLTFTVQGCLIAGVRTTEEGIHTGRKRFLLGCITCHELMHESTTGVISRLEEHLTFREDRRRREQEQLSEAFDIGQLRAKLAEPMPMRLHCPTCHLLHVDVGEFATKPHRDHVCQSCGMVWRPALVPTVGVRFLPGHKNKPEEQIVDGQSPSEHKITLTSDGIYTCVCGAIGTFAELTDFNHELFKVARR